MQQIAITILATSGVENFVADNWLSVVIAAIVAIFGGGGIAALIKSKPEGSKIVVEAAQGAVVVQASVIDSLREDLNAARREISELRSHMTELNSLRGRVRELEHMNEILQSENTRMEAQIRVLQRLELERGRAEVNAVQVRGTEKISLG